jgi:hypothetical protein
MMGVEYPRGDEYDKTAVNPWDSDPTGKGFGGASAVCAVPKKQARLAHGICTVIFGRGLVPSLMMNRNIVSCAAVHGLVFIGLRVHHLETGRPY